MKKYLKEVLILLIQIFMFYIFPIFSGPTDAMGMILIILLSTIILSFILTVISKISLKYLYPIIVSIIFVPTVFIYYNNSAMIHSIWYLIVSSLGMFLGSIINILIKIIKSIK